MSLLPKTLFETESLISGKIKVVQVGPERRLMVGGLVQSINFDAPDVGERIWGKLAAQIRNPKHEIRNCLILGLGGGTVAHLLTKRFCPIPIDGVELDPVIVEIGKNFFDLDNLSNLKIIVADAADVLRNPRSYELRTKRYELIIVDLYCGSKYPIAAESPPFFAAIKKLLNSGGLIVFNHISTEKDSAFEEKLDRNFGRFKKTAVPSKFGGENIIYEISSPTLSKQSVKARR